ncbi:hypothetical protein [Streptobacillus moniliformis]|uniref:hypothetical protein n=1 Tax=Streptobacillus moniliformis TaxID=34105 RepID=UPI0007E30094|nr:hypothetical protein [Streptobacillus moniliformis]
MSTFKLDKSKLFLYTFSSLLATKSTSALPPVGTPVGDIEISNPTPTLFTVFSSFTSSIFKLDIFPFIEEFLLITPFKEAFFTLIYSSFEFINSFNEFILSFFTS